MKDRQKTDRKSTAKQAHLSFEEVYYTHYRSLFFFAKQMVENEDEVQDLLSDTFLKYYNRKDDFYEMEQAKAFLFTTVKNTALNWIRHQKVRSSNTDEVVKQLYNDPQEEHFFDKLVLTELMNLVTTEMERLPQKQQEVFKMAYFEDRTTEEIAHILGIRPEAVYNNKKRALLKLQKIFKNKDFRIYVVFIKLFFD